MPFAASVASGVLFSHLVQRPSGFGRVLGWWLLIAAMSTVVLIAVDRVARRFLPLATLLKLSMAFPDHAPSRLSVATRAGTTRSLQDQLRRAQEEGINDRPSQAAQRILTLVGALGAHDRRTRGHSERVRAFNDLIAAELRLPQHDRDRLRWAALLHDIGKLHVSARILNKPKRPTEKEWAILKSHPERGARIAAPLAEWLGPWAHSIEHHHERWDGGGYPNGLSGTDISLGGRIVAVADAYEVMTAPRPYSRPVSAAAARQELARCAGAQFDPEIVRAFLSISIGSLRKVIGPLSWLAQLPLIGATPRLEAAVGIAGRQAMSAAATATGTGVLAVAIIPHAVDHHHQPVTHLAMLASDSSATGSHHSPGHAPARGPQASQPVDSRRTADPQAQGTRTLGALTMSARHGAASFAPTATGSPQVPAPSTEAATSTGSQSSSDQSPADSNPGTAPVAEAPPLVPAQSQPQQPTDQPAPPPSSTPSPAATHQAKPPKPHPAPKAPKPKPAKPNPPTSNPTEQPPPPPPAPPQEQQGPGGHGNGPQKGNPDSGQGRGDAGDNGNGKDNGNGNDNGGGGHGPDNGGGGHGGGNGKH